MYFKEEKREQQKLKVKPSVWLLAQEIACRLDPHDEEPDIDKLFQRLVISIAHDLKLLQPEIAQQEIPNSSHIEAIDYPGLDANLTAEDQDINVQDMLGA